MSVKSIDWKTVQRIVIIGGSGAGKTTLGRGLSGLTGLPHIRQDGFQFGTDGCKLPVEEINQRRRTHLASPSWIFDGNAQGFMTREQVELDVCIWLDLPTWLRLWRVLKRMLTQEWLIVRGKERTYDQRFDAGFLNWVWSVRKRVRKNCRNFSTKISGTTTVVRIRRPRELRALLSTIE